ncbi:MAG: thioredoxin family protein [Candidatus Cloacimonetes bacterium]|nr:thioredoxin family protein [Candidatus Cloacimonadota bacterium]MDY0229479.1 cytochrome c biogenesis protein CcdA [Candidatus Cloacimonadaceae bacterium]
MRLKRGALILILLLVALSLVAQTVTFSISKQALRPGDKGEIRATLLIPSDRKQSVDPADPAYFYLEAAHPDLEFGAGKLPQPTKVISEHEWLYYPKVTLTLPFTVKGKANAGKKSVSTLLSYNLCYESGMCDPPEDKEGKLSFEILEPQAAPQPQEGPVSIAQLAESGDAEPADDASEAVAIEAESARNIPEELPIEQPSPWREVLKYLVFAFLGGLILNITPCVLPILPIRIMAIINQAQKDRSKVFRHVMIYTLGVLISFGILASVFIGIQAAGQSAGWGTQNQNPYFQIGLMAIVFVFALSLLGIFEITAPGMNTASKASTKGGYSGSFFGGIFAFLMAISCTGPFLGAALPFAMKLSSGLIMVFFLLIGLGFAFPFILIGFFPKALKIIPKPGDWMVLFKELMGFVLLYLVYTMLKTTFLLTSAAYFMNVLFFMLILGFATWLYGRFVRFELSKATQWIFTILPILLIAFAVYSYLPLKEEHQIIEVLAPVGTEMVADTHAPEGWYVFTPELHAKLLAEGKIVFLDIGAAWCKNCMANEKTVLFTDEIMAEFQAKGVVLLRGDFTKKDPVLLEWITQHERMGVPFNALYIPGEEPILFPELLSKKMIREVLEKIPYAGVV